ncbi:MAG: amidase, partial [Proteobacteria bacterium]|nr:amidase [Pseudomonadota bacterium]
MKSKIFTYINVSTQPRPDGSMAGTSVIVESGISVANWPGNAQSVALENYVALEDATLILRLRNAGANLKGRTFMAELGLGLDRDTCGDAINSGLSDVVLKTDTTGEARMASAASGC